jgi:hypothetical protein
VVEVLELIYDSSHTDGGGGVMRQEKVIRTVEKGTVFVTHFNRMMHCGVNKFYYIYFTGNIDLTLQCYIMK